MSKNENLGDSQINGWLFYFDPRRQRRFEYPSKVRHFLKFTRVARVYVFALWSRTKTQATRVNSKKCPILIRKGYFCPLCPRKVEMILSNIVPAKKIFARAARVSDLAHHADHSGFGIMMEHFMKGKHQIVSLVQDKFGQLVFSN